MNIKLVYRKDLDFARDAAGSDIPVMFTIPLDSEAGESLSGLMLITKTQDGWTAQTNCRTDIPAEQLLLIDLAARELFRHLTGKNIDDPR